MCLQHSWFSIWKAYAKKNVSGTLDIYVVWGKTYAELANLYENKVILNFWFMNYVLIMDHTGSWNFCKAVIYLCHKHSHIISPNLRILSGNFPIPKSPKQPFEDFAIHFVLALKSRQLGNLLPQRVFRTIVLLFTLFS